MTSLGGSMRRRRWSDWRMAKARPTRSALRTPSRMGASGFRMPPLDDELEDVVVGEAEEGRAEGGEDGQAVGRVVDGAQDGGEGLHLFAGVVLLAADEAVRDAAGRRARPRRGR